MGNSVDEASIIQRAVGGDRAAIDCLLARHYNQLAAWIAPRLPRDLRAILSAEDVLQEALLEACRHMAACRAEDEASFYRWLLASVEHRMRDLVRSARAIKRGGEWHRLDPDHSRVIAGLEQLAVSTRTPSASAVGIEAILAVHSALERLPPGYAEVLRLRYMEGLSIAEIASRTGRTQGSVVMLCHRALRQMARLMGSGSRFLI